MNNETKATGIAPEMTIQDAIKITRLEAATSLNGEVRSALTMLADYAMHVEYAMPVIPHDEPARGEGEKCDTPETAKGWQENYDIPEIGIHWQRFYSPRYVHIIAAWNDGNNSHVYQMTARPWPLSSGERWQVNVTNDGGTVFTMESTSKHLIERCGLAAMRAYLIRGHRKTWRKARAAAKEAQA